MKFLAFSLIGLGLLVQQTQANFDAYLADSFASRTNQINSLGSFVNNIQASLGSTFSTATDPLSQGVQNMFIGTNPYQAFNFGTIPNFNLGSQTLNLQTLTSLVNNLRTETQGIPTNPLESLDPSKWLIFDNQKSFCFSPRVWDGQTCKCPNNGIFLSGKCYYERPLQFNNDLSALRLINRNFDGTQNNPNKPELGSKSSEVLRLCPANYQDGKSKLWDNLPNPRQISNLVGDLEGPVKQSRLGLNMLFSQWGQFLDHDITFTPTTPTQNMDIPIPKCDKIFDTKCTGTKKFPNSRSVTVPNAQIRTQINILTPWIDASMVYGSDKQTANSLRQFKNGKLKTSTGNFLPKDQTGNFIAGDFRVNQNIALTIFQTIFMRQHNRICDLVISRNSALTDEEVFQIARNYVIGLVQHITFDEYLPALLGKANFDAFIGPYKYDPNENPSIITEFSSAAFRLGHPLINSPLKLMDNFGNLIRNLNLGQMFFNPSILNTNTFDQFINGLARTSSKQRSLQIVNDLRNFLFFPPLGEVNIDLFSFNVQRGRDHGVCSLGELRQKMGLPKKALKDLFEDPTKAKILQKLFHDPSNVDLWLGIIGQKSEPGAVLGELGIRVNAFQFKRMRNADRLWYENVYPDFIVREIKATSFADVIKRNTGVRNLNFETFKKVF